MKIACIVIGSYVNGYAIVQELYENGVDDIYVLDTEKDVAAYSNMVKGFFQIRNTPQSIERALFEFAEVYDLLVLYPNQDIYVQHLNDLYSKLKSFCLMAFNPENASAYQDKMLQYEFCEKLDIPCPVTKIISSQNDLDLLHDLSYPILFKPTKRDNLKSDVFRIKIVENEHELSSFMPYLQAFIASKFSFIASEVIPGDSSSVFAYTAYRNSDGNILGEWGGQKLSQFPNDYGVFSSASNEAPDVVMQQGRKLLNEMNLWGINEPEFKYDYRDGQYKLMEINLRPMMWHRVGALDGVPLNYIQYLDLLGMQVPIFLQKKTELIHFVYEHHEWINLLTRKAYWNVFKYNLFMGEKRYFALFNLKDIKPFLFSFVSIYRRVIRVKKRNK